MSDQSVKPLLLSSSGQRASNHTIQPKYQRYILVHPNDLDLPYVKQAPYSLTRAATDTESITFVDLTEEQAKALEPVLETVNGSIQANEDFAISIPLVEDEEETLGDDASDASAGASIGAAATAKAKATKPKATSKYPSTAPTCSKIKVSDDFILFFPDTMVNLKKFPAANLSIGNNYSGVDKPCNPHADYTYSVFKQVLGDAQLEAVNIPVFGCGGHGSYEAITSAFLDILDYKKSHPTKKVAVFFAVSGGGKNAAETAAVKALVNAGVLVGVSAGNNGANYCSKDFPPWNVPGVLQIGATMAPGNRCPYFTNWSGVTPQSQFGDCVNAYLPGVFKVKQFNKPVKGTSFAIPQAVAWIVRWWNQNPNAKASETIKAFMDHTVMITKAGPSYYPPLTADGLMRVIETNGFCSTNVGNNNNTGNNNKPRPN